LYSINVVVADESISNQLLALLNHGEFEVCMETPDFGAGVLKARPRWECAALRAPSAESMRSG
jgi:hypothetical protein